MEHVQRQVADAIELLASGGYFRVCMSVPRRCGVTTALVHSLNWLATTRNVIVICCATDKPYYERAGVTAYAYDE